MEKTLTTKRHQKLIELLIRYREKAGLTQSELAEKLDEYQSFIARMESGQRRLDVVEFLTLAELLRFDAVDVLKQLKRVKH